MNQFRLCVLCVATTTIVPVFAARLAAATGSSQDVPVPGGTEAFATALAIDPVPDRGRFISEITRLAYDTDARNPVAAGFLAMLRAPLPRGKKLTLPFDDGSAELVPVPLTVEIWGNAVFKRKLAPEELVAAIVADRQAALVCHGLAALDDETLQYFADHSSLVSRVYERSAPMFAVFSGSLRIRGNGVVPPGGPASAPLWEAVVGEKVTRPERFVATLFEANEGRLANVYDIAGHADPPLRAFILGSWMADQAVRLDRFKQLAASLGAFKDWHIRTLPYGHATHDLASTITRIAVRDDGTPAPPASRAWWTRIFSGTDLAEDAPPRTGDSQPFDAAWIAETIGSADVRLRGERLDQIAFAQRLFGATADAAVSAELASSAFTATRALPQFRMLLLTLERAGVRSPIVFASASRHAARLAGLDGGRGFTAHALLQGSIALVARMANVRTIDARQAESLVEKLVAVPLNEDGRYAGGIARWLSDDVGPAIGLGADAEAAVLHALGGAASANPGPPTRIVWEGQEYRLDLGFAERKRLERVRHKQNALPVDVPLQLAAIARPLTGGTPSAASVEAAIARLTAIAGDFPRYARHDESQVFSGAGSITEVEQDLRKAIEELTRAARTRDMKRAERAGASLTEAADQVLARTMLSLAYAMYIGDPEGTVLLAGDVSYRHDFGFALKDSSLRARAAWALPRQDVSPGVPWHIGGSLLGLDLALAPLALRRLNFDHLTHAPKLTSNERDTFAISVALMNPYALSDADRDAIDDGIQRGRARLAAAIEQPAEFDALADALALDGARRRALGWTLAHDAPSVPSMFTLSELLSLGGGTRFQDLNAWGMSALSTNGCLCVRLSPPGRWWLLRGRPQLGIVATALPDLNLHVAGRLRELRVPAALLRVVVSAAMQDFLDSVAPADDGDWLTMSRTARVATREQVEDYLASATADGPLVPVTRTSQP